MNYADQFFQIRAFKFFTSATELRFTVLKIKSHKMHNADGKYFLAHHHYLLVASIKKYAQCHVLLYNWLLQSPVGPCII